MKKYGINLPEEWDNQWIEKFDHYQNDKRFAYYIRAILNDNEKKILEIAAGSFRDVGTLNHWGYDCSGMDFSEKSVEKAKKNFPAFADKLYCKDAFSTNFIDNQFDFSYHNGLWIYFEDDKITQLLKEQIRITKQRIVIAVHNAHNLQFIEYFKKLSSNDPLYNIRFFHVEEITNIISPFCKNVQIIPVGKGKKYFEDDLINIGLGDATYIKKSFDYHKMSLLNSSERLLCIGEL